MAMIIVRIGFSVPGPTRDIKHHFSPKIQAKASDETGVLQLALIVGLGQSNGVTRVTEGSYQRPAKGAMATKTALAVSGLRASERG
jgi:hypothetical protein